MSYRHIRLKALLRFKFSAPQDRSWPAVKNTVGVFDPKCLNTEECGWDHGGMQIREIAESDLNFLIASLIEIL